jgi:peptidoglycan L-alanyl-D-glutamate endopeptidase CwlK
MTFSFSQRSKDKLATTHEKLQTLFNTAITNSPFDFGITQGIRTKEEQQKLFNEGKSQTLNSRHLTGKAVDIAVFVNGKLTWEFDKYKQVADHIKQVATELNIPIVWGGDWKSFKDGPHFELNKKEYP